MNSKIPENIAKKIEKLRKDAAECKKGEEQYKELERQELALAEAHRQQAKEWHKFYGEYVCARYNLESQAKNLELEYLL